ncbi:MAG TPA: hypothetical protein VEJ84_20565, partial [Acidimicrobiales bacterium]|nr:hypothetical protein [Acidimicrobiales bacterium]
MAAQRGATVTDSGQISRGQSIWDVPGPRSGRVSGFWVHRQAFWTPKRDEITIWRPENAVLHRKAASKHGAEPARRKRGAWERAARTQEDGWAQRAAEPPPRAVDNHQIATQVQSTGTQPAQDGAGAGGRTGRGGGRRTGWRTAHGVAGSAPGGGQRTGRR